MSQPPEIGGRTGFPPPPPLLFTPHAFHAALAANPQMQQHLALLTAAQLSHVAAIAAGQSPPFLPQSPPMGPTPHERGIPFAVGLPVPLPAGASLVPPPHFRHAAGGPPSVASGRSSRGTTPSDSERSGAAGGGSGSSARLASRPQVLKSRAERNQQHSAAAPTTAGAPAAQQALDAARRSGARPMLRARWTPPPGSPSTAATILAPPPASCVAETAHAASSDDAAAAAAAEDTAGGGSSGGEETDAHRIQQRAKQIAFGKATQGYANFRRAVPFLCRQPGNANHPATPAVRQRCSKRRWDAIVGEWRRALHRWDESPNPLLMVDAARPVPGGLDEPALAEYNEATERELCSVRLAIAKFHSREGAAALRAIIAGGTGGQSDSEAPPADAAPAAGDASMDERSPRGARDHHRPPRLSEAVAEASRHPFDWSCEVFVQDGHALEGSSGGTTVSGSAAAGAAAAGAGALSPIRPRRGADASTSASSSVTPRPEHVDAGESSVCQTAGGGDDDLCAVHVRAEVRTGDERGVRSFVLPAGDPQALFDGIRQRFGANCELYFSAASGNYLQRLGCPSDVAELLAMANVRDRGQIQLPPLVCVMTSPAAAAAAAGANAGSEIVREFLCDASAPAAATALLQAPTPSFATGRGTSTFTPSQQAELLSTVLSGLPHLQHPAGGTPLATHDYVVTPNSFFSPGTARGE